MKNKKHGIIYLSVAVMLIAALMIVSCAKPAPAPAPAPAPKPAPAPAPKPAPAPAPKPAPAPAPKPAYKLPDPLVSTALDVGSGGYLMAAAVADAMSKENGITMRVIPSGTDVGRLSLVNAKRAHMAWSGFGFHFAQEGVYDFALTEWGPQPVRLVAAGVPLAGMLYATAADAGIETWADAKGKRFAQIPGYPGANAVGAAALAFGGLTWDDVEVVEFPSFGAAARGVIEGKVDAACAATYSSWTFELEGSPRGLRFVPFPHDEKEAWARMQSVVPVMQPIMATVGAGLDKDNPLEAGSYPNPFILVYDWSEDNMVYEVAKLVYELFPVFGKVSVPGIEQFDPERRVYSYAIPYHPAAIRYYKEIGVWTAENDKNNDVLVKRQATLMSLWEKAIADALEQKIKAKDFPKFWMEERAKKLEAAGLDVYYR
ncbi:TAXI family TRAP transporter solute-binding subunit [Chloroflexota bacterium]